MTVSEQELAELVVVMDTAADAYINGRIHEYLSLIDHSDDTSLMAPYGGETRDGVQRTEEAIAEISRFFSGGGEATFEVQHAMTGGDLVVLAGIERQHGQVGDYPDQDWSLRVTLVFRHVDGRWQLLHRHADALVREIPFDHLAELARGLHAIALD